MFDFNRTAFLEDTKKIFASAIAFKTVEGKEQYRVYFPGNDHQDYNTSKAQRNAAGRKIKTANRQHGNLNIYTIGVRPLEMTIHEDTARSKTTAYCLECDQKFGIFQDMLARNGLTIPVIECTSLDLPAVKDTIENYDYKREKFPLPKFLNGGEHHDIDDDAQPELKKQRTNGNEFKKPQGRILTGSEIRTITEERLKKGFIANLGDEKKDNFSLFVPKDAKLSFIRDLLRAAWGPKDTIVKDIKPSQVAGRPLLDGMLQLVIHNKQRADALATHYELPVVNDGNPISSKALKEQHATTFMRQ